MKLLAKILIVCMLTVAIFGNAATVNAALGNKSPLQASSSVWLEGSGIAVEVDNHTALSVYLLDDNGNRTPLTEAPDHAGMTASVKIGSTTVDDFIVKNYDRENGIQGLLGTGNRLTVTGESVSTSLVRKIVLETADSHPGVVFMKTSYLNADGDVIADRFVENNFTLIPVDPPAQGTKLWSFQGAAVEWGMDYVLPIKNGKIDQNEFAKFGGIPYVDVYSCGGGLGLGSASPVQLDGISIPVTGANDTAKIRFEWPGITLKAGVETEIGTTILTAHTGDFYNGCRAYALAMADDDIGIAAPASFPDAAYDQQWETYGYGADFTIADITSKLDDLVVMGVKSVEIDYGWFIDSAARSTTGDFEIDLEVFPGGGTDGANSLKGLTDAIHAKGLKAILWLMPGVASPASDLAHQHPDWMAQDINGDPQLFQKPWEPENPGPDLLLCPSLEEVRDFEADLATKAVRDWGFDGFKLDSIYNVAGPCYAEGHNHTSPQDAVADYSLIYKAMMDAAVAIKPDFSINICNCGVSQNFYLLPYQNRLITSDVTDSYQVRYRAKAQKAFFGPASPILGDHAELLYPVDFASALATGCILETKYTELAGSKENFYRKWLGLGRDLELSSGEFRGDLYVYGFDNPEAYAVQKNDDMYYGFFSEQPGDQYSGTIELRGLEAGTSYSVVDYGNNINYGMVTGPYAALNVNFVGKLLLKAEKNGSGLPQDNSLANWIGKAPIARAEGDVGDLSLYAQSDGSKLYIKATGLGIGAEEENSYFELDTDFNGATGYISANWADTGIDYMVENGELFSHPANDSDWNWTDLGSVEILKNEDSVEVAIELDRLGFSGANTIDLATVGIAYLKDDFNLIPEREHGLAELIGENVPPEPEAGEPLTSWSGVETIAEGTGYVTGLKAKITDKSLYIRAEGTSHLSKRGIFYINSDNNSATGYHSANWINSGVDYLVQDDKLMRYTGTGDDWSWADTGVTAELCKGRTSAEISIALSAMGVSTPRSMRVSYYLQGGSLVPVKSKHMADLSVPRSPSGPWLIDIAIDGGTEDWSGIDALDTGTDMAAGSFYAADDGTYMYMLVRGEGLDSSGSYFFLDSDNDSSTGYRSAHWSGGNTGVDYLVENGSLFYHPANDGNWDWNYVGPINLQKTAAEVQVSIRLSDLGFNISHIPGTMKLGFLEGDTVLPEEGTELAAYEASGIINESEAPQIPDAGITVDGSMDDWSAEDKLADGTSTTVDAIYGKQDSMVLYMAVTGTDLNDSGDYFFIDSDNNKDTGFFSINWHKAGEATSGMDYMISGGQLYHYGANNGYWDSWVPVNPGDGDPGLVIVRSDDRTVVEVSVPLKLISKDHPTDLNLAYMKTDEHAAPGLGLPMATLPAPDAVSEPEQQPSHDWSSDKPIYSSSVETSIYAAQDSTYLYLLAEGVDLDGQTYVSIDADDKGETGYISSNWSGSGVDYLLDNGNLLKHPENNGDWGLWSPVENADVVIVKTNGILEARIKLADIGLSGPADLKLGFWANEGSTLLPQLGNAMTSLSRPAYIPEGPVASFQTVPNAIGMAVDDEGWMGGPVLWDNTPSGPTRLLTDRDPTIADYETLAEIGRAANTRLDAAFILSELDKNKILAKPEYNPENTGHDFNITEFGTQWTNSEYSGSPAKDMVLDDLMDYVMDNAASMEIGMHGVRHERFINEVQYSAEFGPVIDDSEAPAPPEYSKQELTLKAEAFMELMRQYFGPEESSFPETIVPPRHGWWYEDREGGLTAGAVLSGFGVKYANGATDVCTDLGKGGIDNGVLFMNRNYGASFYEINAVPTTMPMNYGEYGWQEAHFPNLWDAADEWIEYLREINNHPYRYLARNTEQNASQWLYMQDTPIAYLGDGKTFTIDTTGMANDAYTYDLLGTMVLKTPLNGLHISKASITAQDPGNHPQITGYYEDDYGYGYLEIADNGNEMGRLNKDVYTLECVLGETYMPSYVDLTKGTYNVYALNVASNSADVTLKMYGTQDVKIKLPFKPGSKPKSDNANLKVNSYEYSDGFLTMNITGKNIQGETGKISMDTMPATNPGDDDDDDDDDTPDSGSGNHGGADTGTLYGKDKILKVDSVSFNTALRQVQADDAGIRTLKFKVTEDPKANSYGVQLPVPLLSSLSRDIRLEVETPLGFINAPSNMLKQGDIADTANVTLMIGAADIASIPDVNVRRQLESRPVFEISVLVDGKPINWSNPEAPVTIEVLYTPTAEELSDPEHIVVWYIDGAGRINSVPNGRYDPTTGRVRFETTHLSKYTVAYNKVSFMDVAPGAWYGKAVSFIAAREITSGTGNGRFSPEATLTRGQFIVMLMKTYGLEADKNPVNNFSDAGNTFYTGYLAAAKRLGISSGVGNSKFAPEQVITRQEMFTLLYNALKLLNKLPVGDTGKTLADFSDSGSVAPWAREALTVLVKSGTVSGSGGELALSLTTTRAQMAQVLYNLLGK